MAGMTIWGATINHPKWQTLTPNLKYTFIEIGVSVMDIMNLDLPDGFIETTSFDWLPRPNSEYFAALQELERLGFVTHFDQPEGWQLLRWTDKAVRYRPGVKGCEMPCWGQHTMQKIEADMRSNRESTAKSRAKKTAKKRARKSPSPKLHSTKRKVATEGEE